jgi:perosamine synthetase
MDKLATKITKEISNAIEKTIGIPPHSLHEPLIDNSDIKSVLQNLKSGFVSSVGNDIKKFEDLICEFTKAQYSVALVNGTSALHVSLVACGIKENDEILVPSLTFVGSANAIKYSGAIPHFVDSEKDNFGIDYHKLYNYLESNTIICNNTCINKITGRKVTGIMPVHVFGMIGEMDKLLEISEKYNLIIIEDAAEALGSFKYNKHAGLFGKCGCLSFNGNKIVTTGGGGAIITNDKTIASKVRHLSTTAKVTKDFSFFHDEIGFNYRMPAVNAALGISQIKKLKSYIKLKLKLHNLYSKNFQHTEYVDFITGQNHSFYNNWLNSIKLKTSDSNLRDIILFQLNNIGYECRPIWALMSSLPHFKKNPTMDLTNAINIQSTIINIPSSPNLIN